MRRPDPNDKPTWLDRLYVALVCALLITGCGLMAHTCAGLVVRATQ